MQSSRRRILLSTALGVVGFLILLIIAVGLMDWDLLRGPVAHLASAKSGRHVSITGHLRVHLWSSAPSVTVEGLRIDNPSWEISRPLLQLQRLQVQVELRPLFGGHLILRQVELDHPDLYLHQEASGRANWTDENTAPTSATAPAAKPLNLPAIHALSINSGNVTLVNDLQKLRIKGTIQAHAEASDASAQALRIQAHGTINDEPLAVDVSGGSLLALDLQHPYPFKLSIKAAQNEVDASGEVVKPFNLAQIELEASAQGPDLAQLFYLTNLALPNSPPYQLKAHIGRDGQHFTVRNIHGKLGRSDIAGSIDVDVSHHRPSLKANLTSGHLFLSDLTALTGTRAAAAGSLPPGAQAASPAPAARAAEGTRLLFPDAHLEVNRVRAMDADVQFKATSIEAGKVPFSMVDIHVRLKDGVLTLNPVQFAMPEGQLSGAISIDARHDVPAVRMDVRATNIKLDQLKGSGPGATAPVDGVLQARAVIDGKGDSVHDLLSDADGSLVAVIPHGDIRSAFAELTGIDLAGVGLFLTKSEARASIRCGVARFNLTDGTANAQTMIVDTQNVLITGHGKVNLGSEVLDLTIQGQPKKFHLVRVRAPVDIRGHLIKPSILPDKGQLLKQGGIAAALGTLLTPVAALLAFVDPGLAKDQDCSQLLAQAHGSSSDTSSAGSPPIAAANH